jgi:hypothetical protein
MTLSYSKKEKLKSKKQIDQLFFFLNTHTFSPRAQGANVGVI